MKNLINFFVVVLLVFVSGFTFAQSECDDCGDVHTPRVGHFTNTGDFFSGEFKVMTGVNMKSLHAEREIGYSKDITSYGHGRVEGIFSLTGWTLVLGDAAFTPLVGVNAGLNHQWSNERLEFTKTWAFGYRAGFMMTVDQFWAGLSVNSERLYINSEEFNVVGPGLIAGYQLNRVLLQFEGHMLSDGNVTLDQHTLSASYMLDKNNSASLGFFFQMYESPQGMNQIAGLKFATSISGINGNGKRK